MVAVCIVTAFAVTVFTMVFVGDMQEGNVQDVYHVLVVQGVEHVFAVPAGFHQAFFFQHAQLVGNGGLGHFHSFSDIVDAEFPGGDGTKYFHPGFVADYFKETGSPGNQYRR